MYVTLKILKEDIETTNFMNSGDCAITRALKIAGYPNLKDRGADIFDKIGRREVTSISNDDYCSLNKTVQGMYYKRIPTEDFEVTLNLDI